MSELTTDPPATPGPPRRRRRRRRLLKGLAAALLLLVLASIGGAFWVRGRMRANLPRLAGELALAGLAAPVTIERDAFGVPTLRGENRRDVAFATGFVHAQDRFFQMDLLRRSASGELGELFGGLLFEIDREARLYQFRDRAERALAASPAPVRELLESYADGVGAGLADLGSPPFEYAVLRLEPRPWTSVDSLLVGLAMFLELEDIEGDFESFVTLVYDVLPAALADFLLPQGTEWDAPLEGEPILPPPVPGPEVFSLREGARQSAAAPPAAPRPPRAMAGSNLWAVAGEHTADGRALLANDIHLGLLLPNFWYRASLVWNDLGTPRRLTGVTLPGLPLVLVGSNGHVAWGVANGVADTTDVVYLEPVPGDGDAYATPDGPRPFERSTEVLRGRFGSETLTLERTIWGPVIAADHRGRRRSLRLIHEQDEGFDLGMWRLERARDVDEAVAVANTSGTPSLNFVVADAGGRIAWTLLGRLPDRVGLSGRFSGSWSAGDRRWQGVLPADLAPRVMDPESGRLWIGNNRAVEGEKLARAGDGGYIQGARTHQVRDALLALEGARAADMLRLQLDDRALFYERWRDLLLEVLTPAAVAEEPRRAVLRRSLERWHGRAAVDAAGFPAVREFRRAVAAAVFAPLTAACREANEELDYTFVFTYRQLEGPLWRLVEERPLHLLDRRWESWDELLLAQVDAVLDAGFADRTWGQENRAAIKHLFGHVLPLPWLSMPSDPLPGDEHTPRVQLPSYGATLRMVVSPGNEEAGFFHMPGGQSGNPLSPHFGDGHRAWVRGEPTPFLPGPAVHVLRLTPVQPGPAP